MANPKPQTLIYGRTPGDVNVPVKCDADGNLGITATITGADGAILDGANDAIRATVKDYTNSNPLAVINVDTNGDPISGSAVSIADGADVAEGATTNAAVVTDANGTVIGYLRGLVKRLLAQVLDYDTGAGTASQVIIGLALPASGGPVAGGTATNPVRVDPTGTTPQPVSASSLPLPTGAATETSVAGSLAALGATSGAKVITDANGTIQQYLRGLIYLFITAGGALVTASIAAGTNLIGRVSASDETSTIYNGTTALTPKFAPLVASASGATTLVAAVSSKKIRVTNIVLVANAAVNVKFQSHVTPTDLTGLLYLAANTGFAPGYDPTGHFETIAGEALDINLSGGVAVGGWLKYVEV